MFDLYLITAPGPVESLLATTRAALLGARPGRVAVQLRARDLAGRQLLDAARELREITSEAGALLLVNDRVDVALLADADGVHLREDSVDVAAARALMGADTKLVAVSCHDADGVRRVAASGADLATLGPWRQVSGKGPPISAAAFAKAAREAIPVFALGGIAPRSVRATMSRGAAGVAAMRGVFEAPDPAAAVRALLDALDTALGEAP